MAHVLPAHQSNGEGSRAQIVRNRPTHRAGTDDIEVQGMSTVVGNTPLPPLERERGLRRFIRRFKGEGRRVPGWTRSFHALATSSGKMFSFYCATRVVTSTKCFSLISHKVLNVLLIIIPIAWVGHFVKWTPALVFTCEDLMPSF
jgi:hypothetical protein